MPVVLAAALGALAGVFVPRLAYRLSVPSGSPPRSACAACARPFPRHLAAWVRPQRCPGCRARLGPPVWATALGGGVAWGALTWALDPTAAGGRAGLAWPGWAAADGGTVAGLGPTVAGGRAAVAGWLVLAAFLLVALAGVLLAAVDLACLRLPDVVVLPVSGGALALLGAAAAVAGDAGDLLRGLAAAAALAGGYLLLALLPGANLGFGDVKLCLPLGLLLGWLGWGAVLLGAVLPHLINGPVALGLLLAGRAGRRTELPLGPALLAGALLAVVGYAVWRR